MAQITPDKFTDIATIHNDPAVGGDVNISQKDFGKVRVVSAVFTFAGEAAATKLAICRLRPGDIVMPGSKMVCAALGASTTIAIGDDDDSAAADAARYLAATSTVSAVTLLLCNEAVIAKVPYKIAKECWLYATTGGGAATGKVFANILIARAGA